MKWNTQLHSNNVKVKQIAGIHIVYHSNLIAYLKQGILSK